MIADIDGKLAKHGDRVVYAASTNQRGYLRAGIIFEVAEDTIEIIGDNKMHVHRREGKFAVIKSRRQAVRAS